MGMSGGAETTREDRIVNDPDVAALIDAALDRLPRGDHWGAADVRAARGVLETLVYRAVVAREG